MPRRLRRAERRAERAKQVGNGRYCRPLGVVAQRAGKMSWRVTRKKHRERMSHSRPRVLLLNAGLNGHGGNTHALLERVREQLEPAADVVLLHLAAQPGYAAMRLELERADGFVIGTGTHWDSWSHLLQRWLEEATPDEGTALWLGKPAAVIVTQHSVGGKGVLSRLQGVLSTFGCAIPPMSGLVYSLVNQSALQAGAPGSDDLWCLEDTAIVAHNLLVALNGRTGYRAWSVDRTRFGARWIE